MRQLTDQEIELAAKQAAESTRLQGKHEQERLALMQRHADELRALRGGDQADESVGTSSAGPFDAMLPLLAALMSRSVPGAVVAMPGASPDPFGGAVNPPADAPPGVPVVLPPMTTGESWERASSLPAIVRDMPPVSPALAFTGAPIGTTVATAPVAIPPPTGAPLPGTGTHPGCTADRPCAKHGGRGVPLSGPGDGPAPVAQLEPAHYDGRPMTSPGVSCTIFRPCKDCVERSRRPIATTVGP